MKAVYDEMIIPNCLEPRNLDIGASQAGISTPDAFLSTAEFAWGKFERFLQGSI